MSESYKKERETLTTQHTEEANSLRSQVDKHEEISEGRKTQIESLEKTEAELREQLAQLQVSVSNHNEN